MVNNELETLRIHQLLNDVGYIIRVKRGSLTILEPATREMPQQTTVQTMREALKWSEGVETIRFIFGHATKNQS